ncbi:MAG: pseudouridine synthase [Aequoribacter sp.]|uniref:pseudouridine synthase n=1 Tax=Aequoribacter sp. TaxID=2847771 RepID=UPI003C6A0C52
MSDYLVPHSQEPIGILYQDEHLLFVAKPHFLLSVPGKHLLNKDCLISRLQQTYPNARIVHRLDLDTSGTMVIALGKERHAELSRQFRLRQVAKSYIAVVAGEIKENAGTIDLPIRADWENRPRQKVCFERGKPSVTHFTVIARGNNSTRLRLHPVTGRSHQLRLHLLSIGHPILGCDLYADPESLSRSDRLLLHAERLALKHPVTGQWLSIESEPAF